MQIILRDNYLVGRVTEEQQHRDQAAAVRTLEALLYERFGQIDAERERQAHQPDATPASSPAPKG